MRTRQFFGSGAAVCFACVAIPASAAILDTLGGFDASKPGWSAAAKAGFSAKGGNTELLEVSGSAQLQWQNERHRLRALGGYARQTSDAREVAEDGMLHLRHNRLIVGSVHSLSFAQVQRNPFQRLRSRTLFGLGGRVDFLQSDRGGLSLGAAHMVEIEELEGGGGRATDQRLSTFLAATAMLNTTTSLRTTIYAQPLWSEFGDLRAVALLSLSVALTEQLSLELGGQIQHDSRPPDAVEETDWSTSTALKLEI
jgi:putative salt-induced outer membrane protein YdiY